MADVVKLDEKVGRIFSLNQTRNGLAPTSKTQLVTWLGVAGGGLSKYYSIPVTRLGASLEHAIVMALGFGPEESEFEQHGERAWSRWLTTWGDIWRTGTPIELERHLELSNYFVPRTPEDPRLVALLPMIGRAAKSRDPSPPSPAAEQRLQQTEGRYLDRLASIEAVYVCEGNKPKRLRATFTFGTVEVWTEDATYRVSINRCQAQLFIREGSFEPSVDTILVDSRSRPTRRLKVEREYTRINHPSWVLADKEAKTPLRGEYPDLELGLVHGETSEEDEANLIVHKAGFAVFALTSHEREELGILTSLLRYLVTEHVGEIEQRGNYHYHLSSGPILSRGVNRD
jgi:hypothetical protein